MSLSTINRLAIYIHNTHTRVQPKQYKKNYNNNKPNKQKGNIMIDKTKLQEIYDKGTTLSDVNYPSPKGNGLVTAQSY